MTVLEQTGHDPAARARGGPGERREGHAPPGAHWRPRVDPAPPLPEPEPYRLLGGSGADAGAEPAAGADAALWLDLYRHLVRGRRFNTQATALTKQGRLAVYPASTGQEACEVAAALALQERDWLFPSYRDTLAVVARGVDPVAALGLLRGDWHTGYDPHARRVAPLSTPLATQLPHAVGLAHAARLRGDGIGVLALVGDGGTSEGDFHEALNFAAVWRAPVVFLVQNNGFAISVPLAKQTAAPSIAHKAVGYGMPGRLVDGNDAPAVHRVLTEALDRARAGGGPTLVEALTYRVDPHTNADDATRYRTDGEVDAWRAHDPVLLLERELRDRGVLTDRIAEEAVEAAERMAEEMRARFHVEPTLDTEDLFAHVFAERTAQLREQAAQLRAELEAREAAAAGEAPHGDAPAGDAVAGDAAAGDAPNGGVDAGGGTARSGAHGTGGAR